MLMAARQSWAGAWGQLLWSALGAATSATLQLSTDLLQVLIAQKGSQTRLWLELLQEQHQRLRQLKQHQMQELYRGKK
jgi:hypothetical protein